MIDFDESLLTDGVASLDRNLDVSLEPLVLVAVGLKLEPLEQRPELLEVVLDGGPRYDPSPQCVQFCCGLGRLGQVVLDVVALVEAHPQPPGREERRGEGVFLGLDGPVGRQDDVLPLQLGRDVRLARPVVDEHLRNHP